jgi:peptide/nickel transport system permease protein
VCNSHPSQSANNKIVISSDKQVNVMGMLYQVILRRVLIGVITLFCVSAIIFAAIQMLPGDMAQQILGQSATPETLSALRHELGLDQSPLTRYLHWLYGSLHGDFGTSLSNGRPVTEMIGQRMVNTLFLASYTALIAVPLAVTLGLFAALYKDSLYDRFVNVISLAAVSLPEFFIGYILILLFSVTYSVFPSIADVPASASFTDRLHSAFLPVLTLTLVITAHMMRMTRVAVLDLLRLPYIEIQNRDPACAAQCLGPHCQCGCGQPGLPHHRCRGG